MSPFQFLLLLFLLVGPMLPSALAQPEYPNVRIDQGKGDFAPEEPCIAINPTNPDNLVVGTNINHLYRSTDGGKTWTESEIESEHGIFGDPCVVAGPEGNFYFFHLSDPSGKQWRSPDVMDRIVCQRSEDGGTTWNNGSFTGKQSTKDQDKEWGTVDPKTGNLYVTWTQFDEYNSSSAEDSSNILFSRSTDQGETWSPPRRINFRSGNCQDDDGTAEGAVPCVGPKGEVYVAWGLDNTIWFNRSTDQGRTWLRDNLRVSDQPGGWNLKIPGVSRCNGMPVTACDLSNGPNRGALYVNWTDQRNGPRDTDVWIARSDDGGTTWSDPIRVNNDPKGSHQFFSWMTVDPATGCIYIVFYDRRYYTDTQTDVFLAVSEDGGKTFTNERISKRAFIAEESVFIGDYNHITALNGMVRPVWTRMDGNRLSVWTALIQKDTQLPVDK